MSGTDKIEKTPSRGEMVLLPTAVVRTQQATLVVIIAASFVCGGFLYSIKRDLIEQAEKYKALQAYVFDAVKAISPQTAATLPPPSLYEVKKANP